MTNANLRLLLLAGAAVGAVTAAAQTSSTATHHTSTTTHHTTAAAHPAGGCVTTLPPLSPKIPALPAGTPCIKALFTISERLDYISPLVGPEVRENFSNLPMSTTLAYIDEKVGTGELAMPHQWYTVQYTGYLPDGTKFDSSLDHPDKKPITFQNGAHRVIPGWDFGFEGMHVGGRRRLFIPYQLAYGPQGRGPIPPKAELIFDMELISQSAEDPNPRPVPPAGARPGFPGQPGQPGSVPTPPTGAAPGAAPQSARPQTGPDVKPAPTPTGPPSTTPQPPPTAKQPPPPGL